MSFAWSADFRARLLALPARAKATSAAVDGRAQSRRGGRLEFLEHRPYVRGDDPRAIDWNAWMRFRELFTREFTAEEAPEVLVILDRSASMGPEGSGKDRIVREVAAALLWITLSEGGIGALAILAEGGPVSLGRWRSTQRLEPMLSLLERLSSPVGPTHLHRLQHLPPPGASGRLTFLFSDFYVDPLPVESLVSLFRGRGAGALFLVQGEEELLPDLPESGRLLDPESGAILEFSDRRALIESYREELSSHESLVRGIAAQHGLPCAMVRPARAFEEIALAGLERGAR